MRKTFWSSILLNVLMALPAIIAGPFIIFFIKKDWESPLIAFLIMLATVTLLNIVVEFIKLLKRAAVTPWWVISTEIERHKSNNRILDVHSGRIAMNMSKYEDKGELIPGYLDKNKICIFTTELYLARDRIGRKWYGIILKRKENGQLVFHSNYDTYINDSFHAAGYELIGIKTPTPRNRVS